MTATHGRFLDLAAGAPAFPLEPAEALELQAHLRACPDCAGRVTRLQADSAAIGHADPAVSPRLHDRIREVAVTPPRSGPSALGLVVILVLLATVTVGASIGVGAFLAARPAPTSGPLAGRPGDVVRWHTDVVDLAAAEFWIDANDLRFTGAPSVDVRSDPGSLTSWTLETAWMEHGREQRLFLYFAADESAWWIDEVRVYDGTDAAPGKQQWTTFPRGPWARTALGATFEGDLDLQAPSATGPVRLHLGGLRIAVRPDDQITTPIGGGIVLTENGNPAVDGNPFEERGRLRCSGILQLPPQAAEARLLALGYRLSWRWEYSTGSNTGYAEARERAPATGWITGTAVGSSGELIVFVADPSRPFGGPPRDLPADCPTPAP
jgi:hypothetical protein